MILYNACYMGDLNTVESLISSKKPFGFLSGNNNYAIRVASANGHSSIVKMLLKEHSVDPSDMCNEALLKACQNGHYDVVKALLDDPGGRVDPTLSNLRALRAAIYYKHKHIAALLMSDWRIKIKH